MNNLVKVFGAADLINAVVASDIHIVHLPTMKLTAAGIIPVPDLERFNAKLPFWRFHITYLGFGARNNTHRGHRHPD